MFTTTLSILLLTTSTFLLTHASPVSHTPRRPEPDPSTEAWTISTMKMRYFNENTGMGWPWDEGHVFPDTTLEFEVNTLTLLLSDTQYCIILE